MITQRNLRIVRRSMWPGRLKRSLEFRWSWVMVAAMGMLTMTACQPVPIDAALSTETSVAGTSVPPPLTTRAVGYYSSWSTYERAYQVADIPADRLSHISYAFANVRNGACVLGDPFADVEKTFPGDPSNASFKGNFRQLQLLKAKHPKLRSLIAVGGWTWSGGFSAAALTDASRQRFAASCADFMQRYGFDGIDIDWEYPVGGGAAAGRPEDRRNMTLLMQTLRRELDTRGAALSRRFLLTAATPAAAWSLDHFEIDKLVPLVDFFNIMTYDFNGSWAKTTGFNAPLQAAAGDPSPLFTQAAAVDLYTSRGVPAALMNLGIPFYGRGWAGVGPRNNGLFQPATGTLMGTSEPGMWDYRDLLATRINSMPRFWDAKAQVPFLYDAATGVFITYDDPASVRAKAAFARSRGMGGVMMWDLGGDDAQNSLLVAATPGVA